MILRTVAVLALSASMVLAADAPTAVPAEKPLPEPTKPAVPPPSTPEKKPADKPADRPNPKPANTPAEPKKNPAPAAPSTRPSAANKNLAQEMIEKFKAEKQKEKDSAKVAYVDLNQPITEMPPSFALFADTSLTLHSVLTRIHDAREDDDVRGVLVNLGTTSFNLAQAQEIRDALHSFRKAGKRSFVYSDAYDTAAYVAASGATDIVMMSGGEIMIPGVGMEAMFARGLLDKVGVKADYVQIGQYKGADEQYTRTEASEQMRGEMNKILDAMYEQLVDGISYHRNVPKGDVKDLINGVFVSGRVAKQRKLIDHLVDQDGLREMMKKELGREVMLLPNYGIEPREALDFSNPLALMASLTKTDAAGENPNPAVALIYAEGVIVDGDSEESLLGGGGTIGSEDLRKALRVATRDPNVKAIVIRIDSPGGSALASEVMWQATRRAAKEKPVIISIGSMAASGGYYLATAGQHIIADPSAVVGSIGVVGGKFVMKDLFDKIGLRTETFTRGTNADLFSMTSSFNDQQRRLITNWMTQTYEQFTERVMTTRKDKIKDIDEVAHGRIFLAKQARQLGMVDELGGLETALAHAAKVAKLKDDGYDVKIVPGTKTLGDILRGDGPEARMPFRPQVTIAPDSILRTLSPRQARLLRTQLQTIQLMQQRPVMLVSPYIFELK